MRTLELWSMISAAALLALAPACKRASTDSGAAAQEFPADAKRYEVRGAVVGVNAQARELMVKHEEIPGYMAAMTMPFYVSTEAELRPLAPGDQIVGELVVWAKGARLTKIRKVSAPAR